MNSQMNSSPFPTVSIVIPSLCGESEHLKRLTTSALNSGIPEKRLEIVTAVGISPNGRARDVGVTRAHGDYLIFMDDDVSFPEPEDLKKLVSYVDSHPEVGLVGPAQQLPDNLSEKDRRRALQLPRSHVEVPDEFRETDMVTHACLVISRELFLDVGMEHPNLISGTDPDLRNRVRERGLKVGIVPKTRVYHPPIMGLNNLIDKNFKKGRWSRWVREHYPNYHLSTEPDVTSVPEARQNSLADRINRNLEWLRKEILNGHGWAITARLSYVTGYCFETLLSKNWVKTIPYPDPPSPEHPEWSQFLDTLEEQGEVKVLHRGDMMKSNNRESV
ncbi:MAG: glycosyltransferase family 2 protein [bacterium]